MDIFPAAVQRPALLELASVLDSRSAALRRDECGDWRINGRRGHIYAVPEGFMLVVMTDSSHEWAPAKKRLSAFATLRNDGDADGSFILYRLPRNADETRDIRRALDIPRRKHLTAEHREKLRNALKQARLAA